MFVVASSVQVAQLCVGQDQPGRFGHDAHCVLWSSTMRRRRCVRPCTYRCAVQPGVLGCTQSDFPQFRGNRCVRSLRIVLDVCDRASVFEL